MIVARSPLRITLGGGGTDLPSYASVHEGFAVAAAIDAHVTVALSHPLGARDGLSPSEHPILRAAFEMYDVDPDRIAVASWSDVPPGTGLGSSGSFTTALLAALARYRGHAVVPRDLARLASEIEIDRLGLPVGRQDQYVAAEGGILSLKFRRDGGVETAPLPLADDDRLRLARELLLFFTGKARAARVMLGDQDRRTRDADPGMLDNLHAIKELAFRSHEALLAADFEGFGRLMDAHWQVKRRRSTGMSDPVTDAWYQLARANGASGGKLVGAGAGGFLMFHARDPARLRQAMREAGLAELPIRFDPRGTQVIG